MAKHEENKIKKENYQVKNILADNLRLLRNIKGVSQESIAKELHMSRSCYNYIENGVHMPDFVTLCQISEYYNVSLDYMLTIDISRHIMSIIARDKTETEALIFLNKYMRLSQGGKAQVRKRIAALKKQEEEYNIFPWNYDDPQKEETEE